MKVITGGTEEEALMLRDEYLEQIDYDGAMAFMGGWAGIDLSSLEDVSSVVTRRKTWEKILHMVRGREMPPENKDQPSEAERQTSETSL